MSGALSNFVCLDELTQVIYQSFYKFVVLSSVSDDEWNVHVGLASQEGRWWRGCWKEEDVLHFFGPKSTDKLLESFAEKLAEVFIQGELYVSDWSPDKGAEIKFTLGPNTQKPVQIPLYEMTSAEAATYATTMFIDIALQAQSRKCKLYPSASDYTSSLLLYTPGPAATRSAPVQPLQDNSPPRRKESSERSAQYSALNVDLNLGPELLDQVETKQSAKHHIPSPAKGNKIIEAFHTKDSRDPGPSASKPTAPVKAKKGASLANPSKKARKYQAIEFGSDEE